MKGHVLLAACAAAPLALTIGADAHAQTTAETPISDARQAALSEDGLTDIVVTATRIETRLQDTPIAVSALSGQTLRERNIASLTDVSSFVPSLSIGTRSGTGAAGGSISIRGMGVDATDSSAAVGIYVDDVYFASGRGNLLGLLDVDRIEVLRGPQGTLFGRNTIAGAIQYATVNPGQTPGGYINGKVGNQGLATVQGALTLPVNADFALRFAGLYDAQGGYVHDHFANIDRGKTRTTALRVKARWTPTPDITVDLKGEYLRQTGNGRPVLVDAYNNNAQFVYFAGLSGANNVLTDSVISSDFHPGDYASAGFNAPDFFRFRTWSLQGTVAWQLSDALLLKSITSHAWFKSRLAQDLDNTPLSILSTVPAADDTKVFTQELQLSGNIADDLLKFTIGAYYFDSRNRQDPGQGIVSGFAPVAFPYGNPALNVVSRAVYGQATLKLSEQFSFAGGLRYSNESNTSWLIGLTQPRKVSFNNLSPHIGLNFQATPDVLAYVKASRGFRAGGISPNAALPGNGLAFAPETAWTYEAGLRLELFDRLLRFNPTMFMTDWKRIQFNNLIPVAEGVAAVTSNAGNARIKGIELEAELAPTRNLRLTGSLSLLDSHYTSVEFLPFFTWPGGWTAGPVTPPTVLPNITTGTELQRAPKVKFSLGARYTVPLANDSRLVLNTDYSWTDKQASAVTISDQVKLPSYGLLNARVQWESPDRRFSIAAFGTNLTNEYYLVGAVDFAGGYTTGTRQLDPGRPRQYGLEARVQF